MSDFNAKVYQIQFWLCPRPRWEAYSAPPDLLAGFKGQEGKGKGKGKEGEGRGEKGRERRGKGKKEGHAPSTVLQIMPLVAALEEEDAGSVAGPADFHPLLWDYDLVSAIWTVHPNQVPMVADYTSSEQTRPATTSSPSTLCWS